MKYGKLVRDNTYLLVSCCFSIQKCLKNHPKNTNYITICYHKTLNLVDIMYKNKIITNILHIQNNENVERKL